MWQILEYTAEFILIWIALSLLKQWYYKQKKKHNKNYPFGIDSGDKNER
jgi:hypothetical protein